MALTAGAHVGGPAPEFSRNSATGELVSLADFRGKSEVVLFFYPKDDTPVCTAEACSFRDSYQAFRETGAEGIGINSDCSSSHRRFADRRRLPYRLLSAPDETLRRLFGVPRTL